MAQPVSPINTASSLPAIAPSSSRWNHKTVTVVLALTALGFLLYTLFTRYASTSRAPTKIIPSQPLGKGSSVPFTSGLTYQGNPCVNELKPPKFEKYASGIIRFDSTIFKNVPPGTDFHLQCRDSADAIFFVTRAITGAGNLDFFVSNLPFQKYVTIEFAADTEPTKTLHLEIHLTAVFCTIEKNDSGNLKYAVGVLDDSKVLRPDFFSSKPFLGNPLAGLILSAQGSLEPKFNTGELTNKNFSITNLGERSVLLLQLVSNNPDIPVQKQAIALPFVINAKQIATFTLEWLEDLWGIQYKLATGERRVPNDLELRLGGVQQIICPEVQENKDV